MMFWALNFFL